MKVLFARETSKEVRRNTRRNWFKTLQTTSLVENCFAYRRMRSIDTRIRVNAWKGETFHSCAKEEASIRFERRFFRDVAPSAFSLFLSPALLVTLKVQGMTSKRITQQSRCISSIACCYPVLKANAKSDKEKSRERKKYTHIKKKIFQEKL